MIKFERIRKYLLAVGLLLVISAQFLTIGNDLQLYFLIFIIALTGVPHGSLDFFVEKQSFINRNQKISLKSFLFKYLLSMLAYGIAWWLFPTFSLIVFIIMAAYHFGEIDWPLRRDTILDSALYTVYGLLLIAFILTSHITSAAPILETIVQNKLSAEFWIEWGTFLFPYNCFLLGFFMISLLFLRTRLKWDSKVLYQFLLQSLVLISIIYWLPLYLSFGFYFGLWHSILSFNLIHNQMKLTNDWGGWFYMMKKAIPFTTIAWIGILVLIFVSSVFLTEWMVLSNLLMGIAILTLPHLQVFTKIKLG